VYLSFTDPSSVAATVAFTVIGNMQSIVQPPDMTIQPGTRATMQLKPSASGSGGIAAIIAHSDVPIVGEQAQYFGGSPNIGDHSGGTVSGADPATRWAFAGSAADEFTSDTWYVLDLGSKDAHLTATIFGVDGQMASTQRVARAGQLSGLTLDEMKSGQQASSFVWTSDVPVSIVRVLRAGTADIGAIVKGETIGQGGP